MTEQQPRQAGIGLEAYLEEWLQGRPALAAEVASLARLVARTAERFAETGAPMPPTAQPQPPVPGALPNDPPQRAQPETDPPRSAPAGFVPLKIGDADTLQLKLPGTSEEIAAARQSAEREATADAWERPRTTDLDLVARRCALKAEGCRAFIDRRAAAGTLDEPAHVERLSALIRRAKEMPDCFLWMFYREKPQPGDEDLRLIARTYENLAAACRVVEPIPPDESPDTRRGALALLAEAQSALRIALTQTWLTAPDRDQDDAFRYLDQATAYERIYLDRYMRLDDGADPRSADDLARRIAEAHRGRTEAAAWRERVDDLLRKIRYHVRRIASGPAHADTDDWERVRRAVDELAQGGLRAGDPRLRDLVRPLVGAPPEGFEPGPALGAALDANADQDEDDESPEAPPRRESEALAKVRQMLRGGHVVLVGGIVKDHAKRRLEEAFELEELRWVSIPHHASGQTLEPEIADPRVRLVLVMIKLAGHLHVDDAERYSRKFGKPLVRLPAGYNPEQVAAQVLAQQGRSLASSAERP